LTVYLVSTGFRELDRILQGGYPAKASILLSGPPGVGKEAIGYAFVAGGLQDGELGLYVTRQKSEEVMQDMRGFGIDGSQLTWISKNSDMKCDLNDLAGLSFTIKEALKRSQNEKIRVVFDPCSSLLMLNSTETVYRFVSQLLEDIKQYEAVALATIDEGMHQPQTVAAIAEVFDGLLDLRLFEQGTRLVPLLRVAKMRGLPPQPEYFRLAFPQGKLEIQEYAV